MYRFSLTAIALLLLCGMSLAEPSPQNMQFAALTGEVLPLHSSVTSGDESPDGRIPSASIPSRSSDAALLPSMALNEQSSVLSSSAAVSRRDEQHPDFISFEGSYVKDLVRLNWTVAPGAKALGFAIERRSQCDEQWSTISYSRVNPRKKVSDYSYFDYAGVRGVTYYRLRQVDESGKSLPTPAICVMPSTVPNSFIIWQHTIDPFTRFGTLSFGLGSAMPVRVTMIDSYGRSVATLVESAQLDAGHHILPFSTAALPAGMYTLRLESASGVQSQRLAVL